MSRGVYRSVYSRLYDDPDFQRLTPPARLVLLVARQCDQAGPAAIFRYYPELLARQSGLSVPEVMGALKELTRETWVVHDTLVLWVRNGLRYDPTGLKSADYRKAVENWVNDLPKSPVVLSFCDYYEITHPPRQGVGRVGTPGRDKDSDSEQEQDSEQERNSLVAAAKCAAAECDSEPSFAVFYGKYPRKVGRSAAERAWKHAARKTPAATICAGLERQLDSLNAREMRYIPHPATWLNQGRWDDAPGANGSEFPTTKAKPPSSSVLAGLAMFQERHHARRARAEHAAGSVGAAVHRLPAAGSEPRSNGPPR